MPYCPIRTNYMIKKVTLLLFVCLGIYATAEAQDDEDTFTTTRPDTVKFEQRYSIHFQQTVIGQYHGKFHSPYQDSNSFVAKESSKYSLTADIFSALRVWKGGMIVFNPEMAGGSGLSGTHGIGGFTNGETFRVGDPSPTLYVARAYIRQRFALSKVYGKIADGNNQADEMSSIRSIAITAGKICMADIFDGNTWSHDPRSSFFNWGLMSAGAWDYPANTRGYTYAGIVEYLAPKINIRAAISMVPEVANGPFLDLNFAKANSSTLEIQRNYRLRGHKGVIRLIGFYTQAHMGKYTLARDTHPYITSTRAYGRTKIGGAINIEQGFSSMMGAFFRASYNDGRNETWSFTEIDQSISGGVVFHDFCKKRPEDRFGVALLANGLSKDHSDYLTRGGYGFIIGDGQLNYGIEGIAEAYYAFKLRDGIFLSPDYQYIINPGYNKDRGPISVYGLRGHIEF